VGVNRKNLARKRRRKLKEEKTEERKGVRNAPKKC
jgi:hypothetical protein